MIENLLPSVWRKSDFPLRRAEEHPFFALQREMNRIFDSFFRNFDLLSLDNSMVSGTFVPSVDIRENEQEVIIKAELPGIDEKEIEITLTDDALKIRGEKKEEKEDNNKNYRHRESKYGVFSRVIPLPDGLNRDKVEARFKNGILTVTLPWAEEAKARAKRIAVQME